MNDTLDLFWKGTAKPNEPLLVVPVEDYFVRITNASLGPDANKNTRTCLEVEQASDEPSEVRGIICTLKNNYENHQLNLIVTEDLQLSVAGDNPSPIHLVGYLSPREQYLSENPFDMGDDLMDEEDEIEGEGDEDEDAQMEMLKPKKGGKAAAAKRKFSTLEKSELPKKNAAPIEPASKKQKLKDGKGKPSGTENKETPTNQNNQKKNQPAKEKAKGAAAQVATPKNTQEQPKNTQPKKPAKEWKPGVDGLMYQDIRDGEGKEVKQGSKVQIQFVAQLPTNKVIEKNLTGEGVEFNVGEGKVIEGWEKGLLGLKVGAKRRLKVPAKLAYGEKGLPSKEVPPNTDLTYTIEIKSVS